MPKVSVVMPVYNGAKHIREAIDSVLAQTFLDWDFWIINEYGSNDGSAEIVAEYVRQDSRFHLVQNEKRLGLAESLNLGFRLSEGEYIARLDADDLAHSERFAKQVALMDSHPEVGICGTWQHHFGKDVDWIHKAPANAAQSRANLLFFCDLCHSTLMLRRYVMIENNLYYDKRYASEDYQLWTKAMTVTDIVNISEALGEYRHTEDNITPAKFKRIDKESGRVVARTLWRTLGMNINKEDYDYFNSWANLYYNVPSKVLQQERLSHLRKLLLEIWDTNQKVGFYDPQCLLNAFAAKWGWAKYNASLWETYDVCSLEQVFLIQDPMPPACAALDMIAPKGSQRRKRVKNIFKVLGIKAFQRERVEV